MKTCSRESAPSFTRRMPRRSRPRRSWRAPTSMPSRCSPTTGWRRTTSPARFPRRCGRAVLPPRHGRLRRRSDTSSSPSSSGARYPTPSSVPVSIIPSCSRRRHTRPRAPGLLIARWHSSTRRSGRSATTASSEHRATLLVRRARAAPRPRPRRRGLGGARGGGRIATARLTERSQRPGTRHLCALAGARRPDPARERTGAIARWRRRRPSARRKRSSRLSSCLLSRWSTTVMWRVDSRCFGQSSRRPRAQAFGGSRRGRISASRIFS